MLPVSFWGDNLIWNPSQDIDKRMIAGTYRLVDTHTGPYFQLRRSTDNALTDIYDIAEAQSFLGSNAVGSIRTWYDQSGMGNHLVQVTNSLQPTLVFNAFNGIAALNFNNQRLTRIDNDSLNFTSGNISFLAKAASGSGDLSPWRGVIRKGNYDGGLPDSTAQYAVHCTDQHYFPCLRSQQDINTTLFFGWACGSFGGAGAKINGQLLGVRKFENANIPITRLQLEVGRGWFNGAYLGQIAAICLSGNKYLQEKYDSHLMQVL